MSLIVCLSTLEYILDAHVFPCVAPLGISLVVGCEDLLPDLLFLLLWVGTYRCCITSQMQREHWMEAVCPNILVLPLISIILATLHLNSKPGTDLYINAPNCLVWMWYFVLWLWTPPECAQDQCTLELLQWIVVILCSQNKYFVHRIFELSGFPELLIESWNLITSTLSC